MLSMALARLSLLVLLMLSVSCAEDDRRAPARPDAASEDAGPVDANTELPDVPFMGGDATCASVASQAELERRVDIIWVVDNSTSMEPAIRQVERGLNDFAGRVAGSGLDYRVIMLSLKRGEGPSDRYPVCIPQPLASDRDCNNGDRFFHVSIDIRSTQPVEQILGSLAQCPGYSDGESRGSAPWRELLRPGATKTIVVVTDDNSRTCDLPESRCNGSEPELTPLSLENFPFRGDANPCSGNPFNGNELGPGLRTDFYGDLFEGYTFNAIYGRDQSGGRDDVCTYPDGSNPPSSGLTYTTLIERTGGIHAEICDQASSSAWTTFFENIANRVEETARIDCTLNLPDPPDGQAIDPGKVNVSIDAGDTTILPKVPNEEACGAEGGWYYNDDANPTQVILCPVSCTNARDEVRMHGEGAVNVLFGCDTVPI